MKYRTRTYYTDGQKALMWERWKAGWTLHQIAHLFNRAHTSVRGVLAQTGGIRPPQRAVAEGQSIRSICARRTSRCWSGASPACWSASDPTG